MKILAIGAHPDDIEIFMFGILCHFKNKGVSVNLLIATDGSLGGKGNKEKYLPLAPKSITGTLRTFV